MPSLGLGTQIGNASGGFLDSDALAYISKAGIAARTLTPTSYDAASTFNGTTQYLSVASNSTLTVTGSSFSLGFWLNPAALSTYCIVGKTASTDTREFQIFCNSGSISFAVFPDGTFANKKEVTSAVVALNTWTFVTCVYDSGTGTISVYLNAGTPASVASVPAITQTNTNPFQLGVFTSSLYYFSGKIGAVNFWKRALSASEITSLFNNGEGLPYSALDSSIKTSLVSWWALNETSGTRADSHGSNTLSNNNTVGTGSGPIVLSRASSSSLISQFVRGIKALGLWNQMVCWPLRSSQNASTTLTAYSLGGLGTYNGALTNIPSSSWATDGLYGTSTSSNVATSLQLPTGNSDRSILSVWRNLSASQFNPIGSTDAGLNRMVLRSNSPTNACADLYNGTGYDIFGSTTVSGNTFSAVSYASSNNGIVFTVNGNTAQTVTLSKSFAASNVILGGYSSYGQGYGVYSFAMAMNGSLTGEDISSIYNIYKNTLGQGLGFL